MNLKWTVLYVPLCSSLFGWRSDQLCMKKKKKNTKENKD